MATVILVRHGRTSANATGVLAGRLPGVQLDQTGHGQAELAGARLAGVPLAGLVTSPLERCRQTARAIATANSALSASVPRTVSDRALSECDYGSWQGRPLKELAREPLWKVVQSQPSAVVFPDGESMSGMQARAVATVRRRDAAVDAAGGGVWVAVSHGDVIKSVLADALGLHLDLFQRINIDPGSISVIRYTASRPFVVSMNTHEGDLSWLAPAPTKRRRKAAEDAAVGGGAGPSSGH